MGYGILSKRSWFFLLAVVIMMTLVLLSRLSVYVLEVQNKSQNSLLRFETTYNGESFTLEFINSVELTPVEEKYIVDKKEGIILEETAFESFGPGLPDPTADSKVHIVMEGRKKLRILDMHLKTGILRVRVSYLRPMKLCFNDKTLSLRQLGEGGDLITVSVNKYSYLVYTGVKIWRSLHLLKLLDRP